MGARPHDDGIGTAREGMPSLGVPSLVGGRDAREWTLDNLQIAGLIPMSTVNWSGRFATSLFLQGCPRACPYRHNSAAIDPRIPGVVAQETLGDLLTRRRGLLDGVMFSGDEATRRIALGATIARVRELGFDVGLHTTGPYPRRLKELLGAGLIDWVGIDVKTTRGNYEAVAGRSGAGERAWESLNTVLAHPKMNHKVRLAAHPGSPGDGFEVTTQAREMGVRIFVLQQARGMETPGGFSTTRPGWDDRVRSLVRDIETLNFGRLIFRGGS